MSFLDNTGVQNLVNDLKAKTDAAYQKTLVSGTNIKTVNGSSLLGSGDLEISGGAQTTWWGTSSTSAGTATKVVVCEGFTLTAGAIISILFSAGNEAAVPTLNVNSTGEIPIRIGDSAPSRSNNTLKWSMGSVLTFVYDGTYFRYLGAKTAGTQIQPEGAGSWYGTSSTAATYSAKFCVVSTFRKTQGAIVSITFSTANTYINGALTLNIDSTGASTIYVNNVATSASNTLLWDAGETLTFVYSGQYYYFVGRNKASGGGSGGGFLITITDQFPYYVMDKTLGEIKEAVSNGICPTVYFAPENSYGTFAYMTPYGSSTRIAVFETSDSPEHYAASSDDAYPNRPGGGNN